jgi:CO/xanthine dehydrogenase Mo-binding subunit
VRVVRVPGGFAFVGGKVSTERTRAMYRMDDMATWREHSRDLLREAEEARLARNVKEARPKWGRTYAGKVRRGAALLLSMVGLAAPAPTRSSTAHGGPT